MIVKTPILIKETLGKKVYDKMEEYRKKIQPHNPNTIIHTAVQGMNIFQEMLKKKNDK